MAVRVNRDGLTFNGVLRLPGIIRIRQGYGGRVDPSYRRLFKEFFAPMPEKHQACGDRVKPAALRNEHRQCNAFPGNRLFRDICCRALIIQKLECFYKLESGYTAVEQKPCNSERAAPPVEPVKDRE